MPFVIGESIGPYRIIEQLGQGGMATVFKAYHASLDRYVALKALHPAFLEDPNFLARFQREARVVAKLDHPNIVPIYDFAEHEGRPYLVMKYIEGETLKARLARGPIPKDEALQILEAVGAALRYAHRQGILHRDVKPSNVILSRDGQIYLADFGLARIAAAGESTLSSDMMLGTPQYISPEQALGKRDLDVGTDIYSFGVLLYEILVGRVPFSADTPYAIIHDHIYSPLPLPGAVNPEVSEAVERLLLKALAKERADRFSDVGAMVDGFRSVLAAEAGETSTRMVKAGAPVIEPAVEPIAAPQPQVVEPLPVEEIATAAAAPGAPEAAETAETAETAAAPDFVVHLDLASKEAGPRPARKPKIWLVIPALIVVICLCVFVWARLGSRIVRSLSGTEAIPTDLGPEAPPGLSTEQYAAINAAQTRAGENPDDPYAHFDLAIAYFDAGMGEMAETPYTTALERAGENAEFYLYAGENLAARQVWPRAAQAYLAAVTYQPQPSPADLRDRFHEAVYQAYASPDAPEVIPVRAIEAVDLPMSIVAAARLELAAGRQRAAMIIIEGFLKRNPDMPEARLLQAEILAQQGQVEQAKTTLTALVDDPAAAEWIRNEARSLLEMPGAPPAASEPAPPTSDVEQALQMVQDHPDDPKAHLALALAYAAQKQYDLYTESLNETIRLASADASFLGMAAKDAAAVGDWLTAARLYLALAQNQTGQLPPEQKAPLQEALFQAAGSAEFTLVIDLAVVEQLDPRLAQILRARYTLYFGDPAKAQEIVSGIPIDAETIPEARLVQAEIYIQVGQPDQARLILEQLKSEQRLPPWVRELAKQIFEVKFP